MLRRPFPLLFLLVFACGAQQMAHRGWRGNGMEPEAWWKHARFVRYGDAAAFASVAAGLDAMSAVGADSLILPDMHPAAGGARPFAEIFGSDDELDELLHEASARRMHVLVRIPLPRATASLGEVRFWMSRGIAGLDVGTVSSGDTASLERMRAALGRYPGQHMLLVHDEPAGALTATASNAKRRSDVAGADRNRTTLLHAVSGDDVQGGVARGPEQLVEVTGTARPAVFALESATAAGLPQAIPTLRSLVPLLLSSGAPVLDARLLATEQDRSALQQTLALRSTHPALRSGRAKVLAQDPGGLRAWLLTNNGRGGLLLLENTAEATVTLKLQAVAAAAGLRGTFLRPLLRSDGAMGSVNLDSGTLPAGAALLGEVRADDARDTTTSLDAPPVAGAVHRRRRR